MTQNILVSTVNQRQILSMDGFSGDVIILICLDYLLLFYNNFSSRICLYTIFR